MKKNEEAKVM